MFRDSGTSDRQKIRATGLILLPSQYPPIFLSITRKGKRDKTVMKTVFLPALSGIYCIVH